MIHYKCECFGIPFQQDLPFINGPLQPEMNLACQKRARKFGTILRFVYLSTQLWKHDWHRYESPKDRLDLWDGNMLKSTPPLELGNISSPLVLLVTRRARVGRQSPLIVNLSHI